jgi:hypothetical protein
MLNLPTTWYKCTLSLQLNLPGPYELRQRYGRSTLVERLGSAILHHYKLIAMTTKENHPADTVNI